MRMVQALLESSSMNRLNLQLQLELELTNVVIKIYLIKENSWSHWWCQVLWNVATRGDPRNQKISELHHWSVMLVDLYQHHALETGFGDFCWWIKMVQAHQLELDNTNIVSEIFFHTFKSSFIVSEGKCHSPIRSCQKSNEGPSGQKAVCNFNATCLWAKD